MSKKKSVSKMVPLKYVNYGIGFREVPNEISLIINISNCPYRCEGCHSPQLQQDIGELLDEWSLAKIIDSFTDTPITCIVFMGDGGNRPALGKLIEYCHNKGFLTCVYTGSTNSAELIDFSNKTLDFLKVGRYLKEHGPLDSPNTNQRFYEIHYRGDTNGIEWHELEDITYLFKRKDYENKD